MSEIRGLVADIERASPHDGPGLRTVVFLKGCPLHCAWCHNPECISPKTEELYYPEKCIRCSECAGGCYSGARVLCGREMTVTQAMQPVLADTNYYGTTGGLTVSGGEPLYQSEFTHALAKEARRCGIHCAIETSFALYGEETLRAFDLILFDLKLPHDAKHIEYTGAPVSVIKENILRAAELGIPMEGRTPIIPGVNGDEESVAEIADFLRKIPAVRSYTLLPYHPLGLPKATALGMPQKEFEIPTKEQMEVLSRYAFLR